MAHCALPVTCGIPPLLTTDDVTLADSVPVDDETELATVDRPEAVEAAVEAAEPVEAAVVAALAAAFVVAEAVDSVAEAPVVAEAPPVTEPAVMVTAIQPDAKSSEAKVVVVTP